MYMYCMYYVCMYIKANWFLSVIDLSSVSLYCRLDTFPAHIYTPDRILNICTHLCCIKATRCTICIVVCIKSCLLLICHLSLCTGYFSSQHISIYCIYMYKRMLHESNKVYYTIFNVVCYWSVICHPSRYFSIWLTLYCLTGLNAEWWMMMRKTNMIFFPFHPK